jgi:HEAT repeat protein
MIRRNGKRGFGLLRDRAGLYLDDLITAFHQETDHGLRCWLLELIGEARSPRAVPLLEEELRDPDEALRSWAVRGLERLDTREARTILFHARSGGIID